MICDYNYCASGHYRHFRIYLYHNASRIRIAPSTGWNGAHSTREWRQTPVADTSCVLINREMDNVQKENLCFNANLFANPTLITYTIICDLRKITLTNRGTSWELNSRSATRGVPNILRDHVAECSPMSPAPTQTNPVHPPATHSWRPISMQFASVQGAALDIGSPITWPFSEHLCKDTNGEAPDVTIFIIQIFSKWFWSWQVRIFELGEGDVMPIGQMNMSTDFSWNLPETWHLLL
jgi:hypothetical protein